VIPANPFGQRTGGGYLNAPKGADEFHRRVRELMANYPKCKAKVDYLDDETYYLDPEPLPRQLRNVSGGRGGGRGRAREGGGAHGSGASGGAGSVPLVEGPDDSWSTVSNAVFEKRTHERRRQRQAARQAALGPMLRSSRKVNMPYELRALPVFTNVWPNVDTWVYQRNCRQQQGAGGPGDAACWTKHAQRNMASISGSGGERCSIRAQTLEDAQAACAANAACSGVVRDGGLTCCVPSAEVSRRFNISTPLTCG